MDAGMSQEEAMKVINHFSRDNARTPMHWDATENAGFTTGKPWLQVNPNYTRINLASQKNDPNSVYSFYRQLIQLRNSEEYHETLVYGQTVPYLAEQKNLMAYYRQGEKTVLVMGNFQPQAQAVALPGEIKKVLMNNMDVLNQENGAVNMEGYQFLVLEM
jgi:oligo-1,6-glucosidase